MRISILTFVFGVIVFCGFGQKKSIDTSQTVSFLFIGDIMGHGPQITAAYNPTTKTYSYDNMYKYIKNLISTPDFTIANLEVTLAGPPYDGYPQFSSPDALALDSKLNGIDAFVTANNHSCDRGKDGIIRTIKILDLLEIPHTGTFNDVKTRDSLNLLVFKKNGFRIGLLNYTYGTNGLKVPEPTFVNLIDTSLIALDLVKAKSKNLDKIIVFIHWGTEYQSEPNEIQYKTEKFIFDHGADIIIGSHPHVIQKMTYIPKNDSTKEKFIVYSLGNYVSNQRKRKTDGGVMVQLTFAKNDSNQTYIKDQGYYLTWVNKVLEDGKNQYYILPASKFETDTSFFSNISQFNAMKTYISDSRELLNSQNINVPEYKFINDKWGINKEGEALIIPNKSKL